MEDGKEGSCAEGSERGEGGGGRKKRQIVFMKQSHRWTDTDRHRQTDRHLGVEGELQQ